MVTDGPLKQYRDYYYKIFDLIGSRAVEGPAYPVWDRVKPVPTKEQISPSLSQAKNCIVDLGVVWMPSPPTATVL